MKPEYSKYRDLSYSQWHRTLSSKCYAMNLDWIEIRGNNIVAIIEEKDDRGSLSEWKKEIFLKIAYALDIPAYLTFHNCCMRDDHKELWKFRVINLKTNEIKIMNEKQYREFLEKINNKNL